MRFIQFCIYYEELKKNIIEVSKYIAKSAYRYYNSIQMYYELECFKKSQIFCIYLQHKNKLRYRSTIINKNIITKLFFMHVIIKKKKSLALHAFAKRYITLNNYSFNHFIYLMFVLFIYKITICKKSDSALLFIIVSSLILSVQGV